LEFPLREIAIVQQIEDKQFGGIGEEPSDHVTQGVPAGLLAADNSAIDNGPAFSGLRMPDVEGFFSRHDRLQQLRN